MKTNRTIPTDVLIPHIVYKDLNKAVGWLERVFGFEEHFRYGGNPPSGVQARLAKAWMMLVEARPGRTSPAECGQMTQMLSIFLENVEEHFQRARAEGAEIVEEPHETVYGEFQYAAKDLEGHLWVFSRHAKDLAPGDWGAEEKKPFAANHSSTAQRRTHHRGHREGIGREKNRSVAAPGIATIFDFGQ